MFGLLQNFGVEFTYVIGRRKLKIIEPMIAEEERKENFPI